MSFEPDENLDALSILITKVDKLKRPRLLKHHVEYYFDDDMQRFYQRAEWFNTRTDSYKKRVWEIVDKYGNPEKAFTI